MAKRGRSWLATETGCNYLTMSAEVRTVLPSIIDGLFLWLGEAAVGCVPLMSHWLAASFLLPGRSPLQHPVSEECVLAVVIAGLSLLPFFHFGRHSKAFPVSMLTYVNVIIAFLTSVAGSVMYGLTLINDDRGPEDLVLCNLALALLASLMLSMERSVMAADEHGNTGVIG